MYQTFTNLNECINAFCDMNNLDFIRVDKSICQISNDKDEMLITYDFFNFNAEHIHKNNYSVTSNFKIECKTTSQEFHDEYYNKLYQFIYNHFEYISVLN